MAVNSRQNQYWGVNAHLHSHFQSKGGWEGFHGKYIADLAEAVNDRLPEGYLVDMEQSLQLREYHPDTGELLLHKPRPDLTIYQAASSGGSPAASTEGPVATLTQTVIETLDFSEDLYLTAAVIYRIVDDATLGRPVTRIELLSASNKSGNGEVIYREKRAAALKSALRLVEIDYLHETPSPIKGVPCYPHQPGSYPYSITISNPTPSLETGPANTHSFSADTPIPALDIPLEGTDSFSLDFGEVYNITFRSLRAYRYRVDYEQLPERFETYSEADQRRIRRRMEIVLNAARNGLNLEDGPFPLEEETAP